MSFDPLMPSYWLSDSQGLYDDGIITYKAPRGTYRRVFKRLERRTGLNFERVKRGKVDIRCVYSDEDANYAGIAERTNSNTEVFKLTTISEYKGYDVEAHEIGHALGLGHVDKYNTVMSTGWAYTNWFFSNWDLHNIRDVYDLGTSV